MKSGMIRYYCSTDRPRLQGGEKKKQKNFRKMKKTLDKSGGLWYYNKAVFTEEDASVVQW